MSPFELKFKHCLCIKYNMHLDSSFYMVLSFVPMASVLVTVQVLDIKCVSKNDNKIILLIK